MTQSESGKQDDETKRRNWAEPVGRATSLGATAFARAGFRDPSLVLRWAEVVGPEIAQFATPIKLSDSPTGGVLTLKTEPATSTFLQHETRRLCERINGFLGRPAVARLRFVQGSVAARPPSATRRPAPAEVPGADPARSFAGPDPLRSALVNLARARQRPVHD